MNAWGDDEIDWDRDDRYVNKIVKQEKENKMLIPIEMAPKDGSEFLGYDSKTERFGICNYSKNGDGVDVLVKTHSEGVFVEETDFGYNMENITHCGPLPEKPPKRDYVSWYDGYEKTD